MQMLIGGKQAEASDRKVIEVINPATSQPVDTVPSATEEDIRRALDAAQEGKLIWSATPLHERTRILLKGADLMESHREELAVLMARESGKAIRDCRAEMSSCPLILRGFAERANHIGGELQPRNMPGLENDLVLTVREPLGVVVCVIPFNFPASTYCYKVTAALAMGNAAIVKPATDDPLVGIRITELLLEAGVPGSALQVITGRGGIIGDLLVSSPMIDAVNLTGSTEVGVRVSRLAAEHLHHVFLELGGNDALVVFEDGDLELAVGELMIGRIAHTGQVCIASKRLLVQNAVKDRFVSLLTERLRNLRVGDPMSPDTDMGCLISEKAAMEVERQIAHTVAQGARCVLGGKRFDKTFFEPTVLTDVTPDMDIAKDMEVFGPVMPIIGFETEREAVEIANASMYGLSGGVITRDINRAMRMATALHTGMVVINGTGRYRFPELPFGGCKMSGAAREGVSATLEEMSYTKNIVLKRVLQ